MKLQITKLALSHLMIAASWLSSAAAVEESLTPAGDLRGSTIANRELNSNCDRFRRKISVESFCCHGNCDWGNEAELNMKINNSKMWSHFEDIKEGTCVDVRGFDGWRQIVTEVLWNLKVEIVEDENFLLGDITDELTIGPNRWLKEDALFDPCGTYKRSFTKEFYSVNSQGEQFVSGSWEFKIVVDPHK